jgi:alpha-2-macroglobulin
MKLFRLFWLLVVGWSVVSCSKLGSEVSVTNRNFEDEIQLAQNLVFTFNKDLVPESDLNTWDGTQYIEIEPKIEGKFQWTSRNELVFSPVVGFSPATNYKAKLRKDLLKKAEEKGLSLNSDDSFEFHTPYLQLIGTEGFWAKAKGTNKPVAKLNLKFNYAVNGSDIARLLVVKNAEKELPFQVSQGQASENLTVSIADLQPAQDQTQNLELSIKEGLGMSGATFKTSEIIQSKAILPSSEVNILDVQTGFDGTDGYIRVVTSQELSGERLQDYYSLVSSAGNAPQPEPLVEPLVIDSAVATIDAIAAPTTPVATPSNEDFKAELTDNGFIIRGNFSETDTYVLTLTTKLKSIFGTTLAEEYTKDIFFGETPANIAFVNKKAVYLSSKGNKNIGVNISNVPKVEIQVAKIYENNILQFLRHNRYEDYGNDYYDEEQSEEGDGRDFMRRAVYNYYNDGVENVGDILVNKTVETNNLPKIRNLSVLNMNMPDRNGLRGIFLVTVRSKEEYYKSESKLVAVSDIGLIAKQSGNEVMVVANSIRTAEALSSIEISLVSSNNQTVTVQKTDSKGVVIFKNMKDVPFKAAMITARTDDDFNYMLLEDTKVETSRFEVEGKRDNASGFDAFVYGDRNIYRPGETVYFNAIVRKQNWESVGEIPLKVRLLMPNGSEYKTLRLKTNEQGAVAEQIQMEKSAVTGTYTLEVLNGNDALLTSQNISIEEFMPDRIKVMVNANKEFYRSGETAQISATALNLFGPPAVGRNYEMNLQLKRKRFAPKGFENYVFDIEDNSKFEDQLREGKTNEQGLANEDFLIPTTYTDMGMIEAKCFVTVFDETGRPVNRLKRFDISTQNTFFGIGLRDTYVGTQAPVQVPLVALNKDGKVVSARAQVEIVKFDYQTVIEKNSADELRYVSKKQSKVVYTRIVNVSGNTSAINYVPTTSGEYEIRIHREGARSWTAQQFYAYGWGQTQSTSFEVNNEGHVDIKLEADKCKVGDKVKALFTTPFEGKLLVTVERNRVLEYFMIDTEQKSAELSFKAGSDHLPNVYVSATLIRPLDDSNLPLTVAHGYASVTIEDPDSQLPVQIVAVEKSRSKTKQRITVKTKGNAQVTIAVVDEGILQLKNFKTPDPYGFFYQKRALEVSGHDLYAFLYPELSIRSKSATGGDGYDLEKRINPLSNGRVNLVAFWSGIKTADFNGETTFEVDIPQFSGDLRIMAIAYKDEAFGSANTNMKVADPLVLSTALPRFASPNDQLVVPVNVSNTTKKAATATVTISGTGSLEAIGSTSQTINIAPEREGQVQFSVKAKPSVGQGTVLVKVNGLGETFTEKIDLGVRPTTSLMKVAASGVVQAGQNTNVSLANDFVPSTTKTNLLVSRSPLVQFTKEFQNLLGYPHGCVEQTVSKAFPQIYFADFAKNIAGKINYKTSGKSDFNPNANVQAAIQKLETMQLANGAMSYWQGGDYESWWGTAYAAHFLVEAQKAGFEVNASVLGKALDYLTAQTNKQEIVPYISYLPDGNRIERKIIKHEVLYSLYTLALAGKPNRSMMNYAKGSPDKLTTDQKYLLASAFVLIGDTRSYHAILPKNFGNERPAKDLGDSFYSPVRNAALTLNTLIDTDKDNLQVPVLARVLSQSIKAERYLSTQESAFAFLAMGKLARKASQSSATAKITANGQTLGMFSGTDLSLQNALSGFNIAASGRGEVYYFAQAEGLSNSGKFEQIDNFLKVRKQYYSRSGQALTSANFKQNQLVVVKITLTSSNTDIKNVVVTDMLPAGLEIENPRLTDTKGMDWIKDQATPDHFDIRDDRINYFATATPQPKSFYYLVRAVSKGRFVAGPVSADAMYNGEYRSYSGGGVCVVE